MARNSSLHPGYEHVRSEGDITVERKRGLKALLTPAG